MNTLKLLKTFGNVSICHKFLQTSFVLSKKLDWKDDMKVVLLTTKKVQQENKKRVPDNPDDFDKLQVKSLTKDLDSLEARRKSLMYGQDGKRANKDDDKLQKTIKSLNKDIKIKTRLLENLTASLEKAESSEQNAEVIRQKEFMTLSELKSRASEESKGHTLVHIYQPNQKIPFLRFLMKTEIHKLLQKNRRSDEVHRPIIYEINLETLESSTLKEKNVVINETATEVELLRDIEKVRKYLSKGHFVAMKFNLNAKVPTDIDSKELQKRLQNDISEGNVNISRLIFINF